VVIVAEYVWGVDSAVSKVAFGFASMEWTTVEVEALHVDTDAREGERLGLLDRQVRIYAEQVMNTFPPVCVWIEQASGRYVNQPLIQAIGVISAALYETLRCPVWSMPSGKWKKQALGVGNATKPQIGAWVRRHDPDVFDQDLCDAYAIAYAGRAILKSGQWEAAA
jgi:Holliday junction resolvasome RuvABC endonuclease subunit